jgi:hypothetical protein
MPTFLERLSAQKFSSAASTAFDVFVSGDSNARIAVDAGGKMTWGSGSAAGDVNLYRSAANALKTDDTFQAAAGLLTLTTSGAPSTALADGALAIDTSNNKMYFRSSSAWVDATAHGISTTEADGGSSTAHVRLHINADGGDSTAN